MYDELISKLREDAEFLKISSIYNNTKNEFAERISQASDAIEKLSKELIEMKLLTCCCAEPPKDVHNCFETIDTPILDYMVNPKEET